MSSLTTPAKASPAASPDVERTNTPTIRIGTRLSFLAAGITMACWAPLVPYAKVNVAADDGQLGALLLCLGIGSLLAMPVTGALSARFGARIVTLVGGAMVIAMLPALMLATTPFMLGVSLLIFGAAMGTLDVAINVHAAQVEAGGDRPMMSGFHAMFSLGGFIGAGLMTAALSLGLSPLLAALLGAAAACTCLVGAAPRMLRKPAARSGEKAPLFAVPRGVVLLIAGLCAIAFLIEGAVLDWSALLMVERKVLPTETAGLGFMMMSLAMTIGRLTGDRVVAALGGFKVLLWGGLLTVLGYATILMAPEGVSAMTGFALIGLGCANLVPVLFSRAASQTVMPASLAIAAVTTCGYAGILAGPALIGAVAQITSIATAFWLVAALILIIPACARLVIRRG